MATLLQYLDPDNITGLKVYLGIALGDTSEDDRLKQWWRSGIFRCNEKLSRRDFTEADGFPDDLPPEDVVTGVYEFCKAMREVWRRSSGQKRRKTGAVEEEWTEDSPHAGQRAMAAAWPHLEPYCLNVLNFTSMGGW
jgi:hypothetical protein